MLTLTIFALLSILPSVLVALKCHQVNSGSLLDTQSQSTQPTECQVGSMACTKVIDYSTNTFTKQCQQFNCTSGTMINAPANCQNTTVMGRQQTSCCCYGDGCNSATANSVWLALAAVATSFIGTRVLV